MLKVSAVSRVGSETPWVLTCRQVLEMVEFFAKL